MREPVYEMLWRNKFLTLDCTSIPEMAEVLEDAAKLLRELHATGKVELMDEDISDDYAFFVTEDKAIAEKYGFEEMEFEDEDDEELEDEEVTDEEDN